MSEQAVSRSRTYQAGDWYGVVGPHVLVILPPQEKHRVAAIWSLADEGAGFDETLDALIAGGLRDLHGFVLVSASEGDTKVVIRGAALARFAAGGETVVIRGSEASTWVERSLRDVEGMVIEVGEVADGTPSYEMEHGLVRIARLSEGTIPTADPSGPEDASDEPSEVPGGAIPSYAAGLVAVPSPTVDDDGEDPLAEPGPALEVVEAPVDEPVDEPMEELTEEPEPEPESAGEAEVEAEGEAEVDPWIDPAGSFESSFVTTPAPSDPPVAVPAGDGGLWSPTVVEPADPLAYSSSASEEPEIEDLGVPTEEDLVGPLDDDELPDEEQDELETGVIPAVGGAHAVSVQDLGPTEAFVPTHDDDDEDDDAAAEEDGDDVDDRAVEDSDTTDGDHDGATRFSPFESEDYELARPGIHGQEPAPAVTSRPVARLVISTGDTVDVDRVVVLGRSPVARRYAQDEHPLLVTVPSPHQEISSTHVEVRPGSGADHGTAVVTDLGSTNGTVVVQPGLEPDELQPGVSVQLIPGAVIDLGDGVTISVTRPG